MNPGTMLTLSISLDSANWIKKFNTYINNTFDCKLLSDNNDYYGDNNKDGVLQ